MNNMINVTCPNCGCEIHIEPPAQPESCEITDEQAIKHLQSTGWMQNHDRQMYEMGLKEQLADDSGSYDSLIPNKDCISRQAAIDSMASTLWHYPNECYRNLNEYEFAKALAELGLKSVPPAQPERLTDDDFETIRIHLNAYKEKLCNQRRWKEAEEYQRIIDRFMSFASAHPERKTGEWIDGKRMKHDGTFYWFRQCDQCGYERNDCDTEKDSNFCPNCGADMRGEQHEID